MVANHNYNNKLLITNGNSNGNQEFPGGYSQQEHCNYKSVEKPKWTPRVPGMNQPKPQNPCWVVNNDPDFIGAVQEWGMIPGALVEAMRALGIERVKATIQYVAALGVNRFRAGEDINRQRGRYLNKTLQNGGVFTYYREGR